MSAIVIGGADAPGFMRRMLAGMGVESVRFCATAEAKSLLPDVDILVLGKKERNSPVLPEVVAEARALHVPVIKEESIGRPVGFP
jgi:hypothetical protein